MPLSERERRQIELAESRSVPINWAALDRKFNLTCSVIVTLGVSFEVLVELAKVTTQLIEQADRALALTGIVLFPVICDPAIYVRADKLTHKRSDRAYFVVRNMDFEVWQRARRPKRLKLAVEHFEASIAWIPSRHLPDEDRTFLVEVLHQAAAQMASGVKQIRDFS